MGHSEYFSRTTLLDRNLNTQNIFKEFEGREDVSNSYLQEGRLGPFPFPDLVDFRYTRLLPKPRDKARYKKKSIFKCLRGVHKRLINEESINGFLFSFRRILLSEREPTYSLIGCQQNGLEGDSRHLLPPVSHLDTCHPMSVWSMKN